jgi:hypothetical protein
MSSGFDMRPMGIVATNFLRFSGVSGMPHEHLEEAGFPDHWVDDVHANLVGPELGPAMERDVTIAAPLRAVVPGKVRGEAVHPRWKRS